MKYKPSQLVRSYDCARNMHPNGITHTQKLIHYVKSYVQK